MKTVVWFGNAGSRYGDFGIPNLRIARDGLHQAAKQAPLQLLVISNDEAKFAAVAADFDIPCQYRQWGRSTALHDIAQADVCIVPNSKDRFSLAKSANRIVLALSLGVPVVATYVPAAEPLRPFVIFDDWAGGLTTYLRDRTRVLSDVSGAQALIAMHYSAARMGERWAEIMGEAGEPRRSAPTGRLAFVEREQDLGLALELYKAGQTTMIGIVTDLAVGRPELLLELAGSRAEYCLFRRHDLLRGRVDLAGVSTVITWADEGARPLSRAFDSVARRAGLQVCVLSERAPETAWRRMANNEAESRER